MKNFKFYLIICGLSLSACLAKAQESEQPVFPKNTISVNLDLAGFHHDGVLGAGGASVSVERKIYNTREIRVHAIGQVGLFSQLLAAGGVSYKLGLNMVTGVGNHHFEAQGGLSVLHVTETAFTSGDPWNPERELNEFFYYPLTSIGYRYQRPGKSGMVYKVLLGTFNQLSIGYAF